MLDVSARLMLFVAFVLAMTGFVVINTSDDLDECRQKLDHISHTGKKVLEGNK